MHIVRPVLRRVNIEKARETAEKAEKCFRMALPHFRTLQLKIELSEFSFKNCFILEASILKMVSQQKLCSLILLLTIFLNVFANKLSPEAVCAPRSTVETALRRGEEVLESSLQPAEAEELLSRLRLRIRSRGNLFCFTREDFSIFGHILATAIVKNGMHDPTFTKKTNSPLNNSNLKQPLSRVANFARPSHSKKSFTTNHRRCQCECKTGDEGWCGDSKPVCCAKYCTNIFKAIAVGALAALFEDGHSACCRDSAYKCRIPGQLKSSKHGKGSSHQLIAASKSPAPQFRFKLPAEKRSGSNPSEGMGKFGDQVSRSASPVSTAIPVAISEKNKLAEKPSSSKTTPTIGDQPLSSNELTSTLTEVAVLESEVAGSTTAPA